ncbi:MAG: glutamate racemase, partial [Chloroflexota bacterium]|nr:glutamate racemase [Chloroflexota bacterium]
MNNQGPIGVFDSGLGGLSVLREMRTLLLAEDVLYYADNAYCPYGIRSREEIQDRSERISRLLIGLGAKAIVVACNTASAMAIEHLRAEFPAMPFVGLEPAVKPAVKLTRSGKVGVLATPRTVTGERLRWLIETYANGIEVRTVAATGLVELVEAGTLSGPVVVETLRPLLDPMLEAGVDVVVLGCTHYPFLRAEIETYVGERVPVIDSGVAIATRTRVVLEQHGLLGDRGSAGSVRMMTSAEAGPIDGVARLLMPDAPTMMSVPVEDVTGSRTSNRLKGV